MSSLLREILDRIEYERLIEEGKDPIELLHYKFQNVPSDVIDSVIEIDPTKKKSYSQWLLSKWDNEKDVIVDNLENGRIAKLFQYYKEHNDIQIKDCPSVEEGLSTFVPKEDTVLTKSSSPMTVLMNYGWRKEVPSELANDFDIVFNEDNWVIAVPNTYEADCKLGENTRWCTAGGRSSFADGRYYYDRYLSDSGGKYYVNFDMSEGESRYGKDYPFTRYQFHFESNQFMDSDDDEVELSEIGMPKSAKEFYSSEGYDTDNFENLEARMERYDNQRFGCSYPINEELYLGIAYDDDFNFEEPNEDTDYYLFSNDDDRDPICWEEIPNPNLNEGVVLLNEENICIFKKKYDNNDNSVVVAFNADKGSWSNWEAVSLKEHIVLPNNLGVFGVDGNNHFTVVSKELSETCYSITVDSCEKIFVNEQCTNVYNAENEENIFVEAVCNGYHSLFNISISPTMDDDLICVVYKDFPINEKYFTINEQGLVEGEFKTYRVYGDEYYGGQDSSMQFDLEAKLPTGDYLVSVEQMNNFGRNKRVYNILKQGSSEPLINTWFDKYIAHSKGLYGVKKEAEVGFFSIVNGQQVGRWYDNYSGLDQDKDIIIGKVGNARVGSKKQSDIIDGIQGRTIATFGDVLSLKPANNKIIILDNNSQSTKVFDYVECKFYFPELGEFRKISQYDYPYMFACKINGSEENAIFDLSSQRVVVRGVEDFASASRYCKSFIKLKKMDGKYNLFDLSNNTEMFRNDVDEITSFSEYVNIVVYSLNGKYYPYNYKLNKVVINPNGISLPTFVVSDGDKIYCSSDNYNIFFVKDGGSDDFRFYSWSNKMDSREYGTNFDKMHTPQEVIDAYYLIFGQQESISRKFMEYMSRINEAMRYRYNDIID